MPEPLPPAPPVPAAPPGAADLPARPTWIGALLPVVGIVLLGLFAYGNSLHAAWSFDDRREILNNPAIRDLPGLLGPGGLRAYPNRWVAYVTFAVNHRLGGSEVFGYHLVNLVVHLLAALLVWRLVALAFRSPRLRGSRLAPSAGAVAFLAGVLFVTHPLGTQAVTYVVQRLTSLAALLYLLAVVLFLTWRLAAPPAPSSRARRLVLYAGALLAALAAVKTKEIAFTLPAALVLLEATLFPPEPRRWLAIAPFAGIALLIPAAWLGVRGAPSAGPAGSGGLLAAAEQASRLDTTLPRVDYLRTQVAVVCEYLRLLAWPSGQNLDHDFPVQASWLSPRVLLSLAVLALLVALAAWALRATSTARRAPRDPAWRLVALGIGWWFIALSVESSVIPIVDVIYEHRAYLPSVGLLLAAAVLCGLALERVAGSGTPRLLALTAVGAGLLLGSITLQRNAVWADPVTLWTDVVTKSPGKLRPHQNLGDSLAAAGRLPEAEREFRTAIALAPDSVAARSSLAVVLQRLGRSSEAEAEYRAALALDPGNFAALYNLADLLWRSDRRVEAAGLYRRYLDSAPASAVSARGIAEARIRATPAP